jgi:DNA-binding MarR family transcriptional regulator
VAWTFLTNHAQILVLLLRDPCARSRDFAEATALTERAVQRIISELVGDGYVTAHREGRRNRYEVDLEKSLRCRVFPEHTVADLAEGLSVAKK